MTIQSHSWEGLVDGVPSSGDVEGADDRPDRDGTWRIADLVVEHVRLAGTGHLFAYPGDPVIELLEACQRRDLDVVLARREASAAFMAEGQAMLTGRLGACVSTLGPGSSALVNGVAAATLDRVPMLALSGQIERSREQFFTHQVLDHRALFTPITKWAGSLEPVSAPTILRKAIRTAQAERPGAVHLSCPSDVLTEPGSSDIRIPPGHPAAGVLDVTLAGEGWAEPAALLARATRPVILAGVGATRGQATGPMIALAELGGIPVVVSGMAKGAFPEGHPYFAGVLDMACNTLLWDFLAGSDLIVAVGFDAVELIKPWSIATPVLHVDSVPNTDQIYFAECEVVGDVALGVEWLAAAWKGEPRWSETEVAAHRSRLAAAYYEGRVAGRLNPTDVVDVVRALTPAETLATCDVGSHKLLVGQGWQTHEPRTMFMSNGLSSMGFGIPAAIGAAIAAPGRPVVAIVGDGGFAMSATELRLAASLGLNLTVVVLVDGSLNRIELKQAALGYQSTATRIEYTDVVALAGSLGCDGARVDSVTALERCLADAPPTPARGRPLVIEADVDPSQYQAQF